MRKELQARLAVAGFMQDTLTALAEQKRAGRRAGEGAGGAGAGAGGGGEEQLDAEGEASWLARLSD